MHKCVNTFMGSSGEDFCGKCGEEGASRNSILAYEEMGPTRIGEKSTSALCSDGEHFT